MGHGDLKPLVKRIVQKIKLLPLIDFAPDMNWALLQTNIEGFPSYYALLPYHLKSQELSLDVDRKYVPYVL